MAAAGVVACAALLAVFLYAFDPNIISHGHYVTNDLLITGCLFLAPIAWSIFLSSRRRRDLLLESDRAALPGQRRRRAAEPQADRVGEDGLRVRLLDQQAGDRSWIRVRHEDRGARDRAQEVRQPPVVLLLRRRFRVKRRYTCTTSPWSPGGVGESLCRGFRVEEGVPAEQPASWQAGGQGGRADKVLDDGDLVDRSRSGRVAELVAARVAGMGQG